MLNPKIGDTMLRITPPWKGHDGFTRPGYSQAGVVHSVTENEIELVVQVDTLRHMRFNRADGFDTANLGTFLVHTNSLS